MEGEKVPVQEMQESETIVGSTYVLPRVYAAFVKLPEGIQRVKGE